MWDITTNIFQRKTQTQTFIRTCKPTKEKDKILFGRNPSALRIQTVRSTGKKLLASALRKHTHPNSLTTCTKLQNLYLEKNSRTQSKI